MEPPPPARPAAPPRRRARTGAAPAPAPAAAGGARGRHDDLLPVGDLRREVDRVGVAAPGRAARAADRVADARIAVQEEDARVAHRTRDVHERVRRGRALEADVAVRAGAAGWAAGPGRARRRPWPDRRLRLDPAHAEHDDDEDRGGGRRQLRAGSSGTAATLRGAL